MSCSIKKSFISKCNEEKLKKDSLKISESFEVSIGGVIYGKLKGLIVENDKMEFTINIANNLETYEEK